MKNQPDQSLSNPLAEVEVSPDRDLGNDQADKLPEISDEELALIFIYML